MSQSDQYDPLEYVNLTRNLVRELMSRGPHDLPLKQRFAGAGVYALFYRGSLPFYEQARSPAADRPIYVGKAVPPGARKGEKKAGSNASLYSRISQHCDSIRSAENLNLDDFTCRYLVVVPLWIVMAERFLIEEYRSVWNVCIEGFGNHAPGKGRHEGEVSWWDALHPGRPWAARLRRARTQADALNRLQKYYESGGKGWKPNEPEEDGTDEDERASEST